MPKKHRTKTKEDTSIPHHLIYALSKNGWDKPELLGQHMNAVALSDLRLIVRWGYQPLRTTDIARLSEDNSNIVKLLYQYINEENAHGIRLIARAANAHQPQFKLDSLPLVGAEENGFDIENVQRVRQPLLYALNHKPQMLDTLLDEAKKQKVSDNTLYPYRIAASRHKLGMDLFEVMKEFIQKETQAQKTKSTWALFGDSKATKFEKLDEKFTRRDFWEAFIKLDLIHHDLKSESLTADVVKSLFEQKEGFFKNVAETFNMARLTWGTAGTYGRLQDFIQEKLTAPKDPLVMVQS